MENHILPKCYPALFPTLFKSLSFYFFHGYVFANNGLYSSLVSRSSSIRLINDLNTNIFMHPSSAHSNKK
jgi:hypothetical protein